VRRVEPDGEHRPSRRRRIERVGGRDEADRRRTAGRGRRDAQRPAARDPHARSRGVRNEVGWRDARARHEARRTEPRDDDRDPREEEVDLEVVRRRLEVLADRRGTRRRTSWNGTPAFSSGSSIGQSSDEGKNASPIERRVPW
jgi:hypothetical protein